MPSIILSDNGVSSGSAGLKSTAASDGALALQTTTAGGTATNAVYVDTSQNVGLGTAAPGSKLDILNTTTAQAQFSYSATIFGRIGRLSSGNYEFSAYENGANLIFGTSGVNGSTTERMRLDASGNLGVGVTPSGNYQLQAGSGSGAAGRGFSLMTLAGGYSGGDYPIFGYNFRTTTTGGSYLYNASDVASAIGFSSVITFNTASSGTAGNQISFSERARIDSSGRLLVGTTSALNSTANLSVFNTSGGSSGGLSIGYGSGAAANRWIYLISANGSLYFESSANAASLNSAGAWTNASDARLKNSITDIKYGLSAVLSAQPRSYKMNDLEGDYIGFVAQELQNVIPEVVSGDPEKQLGVDYGSLVAVAFKAIQELKAELDTAKEQIAILQGAQK